MELFLRSLIFILIFSFSLIGTSFAKFDRGLLYDTSRTKSIQKYQYKCTNKKNTKCGEIKLYNYGAFKTGTITFKDGTIINDNRNILWKEKTKGVYTWKDSDLIIDEVKYYTPILVNRVIEVEVDPDNNIIGYTKKFKKFIKKRTEKHYKYLQKSPKNVSTIHEATVYTKASTSTTYLTHPPLDTPKKKESFYWIGKLQMKDGDSYVCHDPEDGTGFIILNVYKNFTKSLNKNKYYDVLGEYVGNVDLEMVGGSMKTFPMLDNCFIFDN